MKIAKIEEFSKKFVGSKQQLEEIKHLYGRFKGDTKKMQPYLTCTERPDFKKVKDAIDAMILAGDLEVLLTFLLD